MKKILLASAIAFTIAFAAVSLARDPSWGGLAGLAVSPDGKTIVTGGQNRVIYVLDAATLEVKQRVWAGARVGVAAGATSAGPAERWRCQSE